MPGTRPGMTPRVGNARNSDTGSCLVKPADAPAHDAASGTRPISQAPARIDTPARHTLNIVPRGALFGLRKTL